MHDNGQQQPLITSRRNPLVKQLRQLHTTRGRREAGLLLLEGTHLLEEALRHGLSLQQVVFTQRWGEHHPTLLGQIPPCLQQSVSEGVLAAAATTVHPDGVVATALLPQAPWPRQPRFLLALHHVQDPGNLGTLLRTAVAAGVTGVVLAQCADPWQPKVLRAAAGASFALPVRQVPGVEPVLAEAHGQGLRTMATCVAGGLPYTQLDWSLPSLLVLGNEGSGLSTGVVSRCQVAVSIPHSGAVNSLNVAVAGALLLFERLRPA
ncbi:MAG: RNA methyltransferase [Synechococcus sp. SB0668_bin_15]|nr:RNA methyltransferase [Synechococcus sp. SB0668_bin_15]MXZ83636.1 RNA methyltransferase [Synechococcus sp. SB0666_bin_14]MYC49754.1 RNA methyltransferase [Synechococcus sp. SB0662_bin_14]MYG46714.1 RNA methyltransferase [Synechococcus sp. SB0675_bin_6]MYJ59370.1 RNA methyltransferase [Synechococcus sp. SB0672_bin_6]MYK90593.1 RNA methyltransferase [Synechococcus sp. SB0669_bin_8]